MGVTGLPFGGFPTSVFAERREGVLASLGRSAMVLSAAPVLHRSGDTEIPYRQDSEFFYLTGFTEPEAVLVLLGSAATDRVVLFQRPRDPEAERWLGSRLGPEMSPATLGVDRALPVASLSDELGGLLAGADAVYFRLGAADRLERLVVAALRTARAKGARTGSGPRSVIDPGVILDDMRLRKDQVELEAIRAASAVTVAGFEAALGRLVPGVGEWELEAELTGTFRRMGSAGPAFPTIVGSGDNACVLHYTANDRRVEEGDLVLFDAGAEVGMYCGDVSRTVPASGRFTSIQRDAYRVVELARDEAVRAIRPGGRVGDVHAAAVRVIVAGLRDLGVLDGGMDELLENEAHKPYFPHRTSHWLGLDTHDVGGYGSGTGRTLEPGMVLTVEPGLYFPPSTHEGAFSGIGIRIEDDVLVTEGGREVLSGALPTDPDDVLRMVGTRTR